MKDFIVPAIVALVISGAVGLAVRGAPVQPASTQPAPQLGALSGPDISSRYLKWGNVAEWRVRQDMVAATTTLCAIANPRSSTTTVETFTVQITTGTSTAAAITLATSTSQYATSTSNEMIADYAVASGAQATITYVPTSNNGILAPNEFLLVDTAGAGLGGYTFGGTCRATFLEM